MDSARQSARTQSDHFGERLKVESENVNKVGISEQDCVSFRFYVTCRHDQLKGCPGLNCIDAVQIFEIKIDRVLDGLGILICIRNLKEQVLILL